MLKRLVAACAAATTLLVLGAAPAFAGVNDFVGEWTNQDADSSGVTRVNVTRSGAILRFNVFGSCHPSDCNWGTANANAFAASAGGNVVNDAILAMAVFNQSFARKTVILRTAGAHLSYEVLTEFTDGSGRANYVERGRLQRAPASGGSGGAAAISEDCVSFTPGRLRVENVGGRWKIVEGTHWVADFGANRSAAEESLAIILRYGFTSQCFVNRPNPVMSYWRRGANVPSLPTGAGEDCIPVNPANVRAQLVSGAWKVVDGGNWLLHFGADRAGAERAAQLIGYHRLNRQCFVARPNPPMTYWLAQP